MAKIKKIYEDSERTKEIYPITHEKAVIDNNGTTAEIKFQMITDLVNQKQMEIGAVPSDLTPKDSSEGWVLSGGVAMMIPHIEDNYYDLTSGKILDASSSSANYGNAVNHTDNAYKVTDFINVSNAVKISNCKVVSKSANSNVYGHAGYVFYDSDKQPISGVVTASNGKFATEIIEINVPDEAVYFRTSTNHSSSSFLLTLEFESVDNSLVASKKDIAIIDNTPTEGNTDHTISSDCVYSVLNGTYQGDHELNLRQRKDLDTMMNTTIYNNGSAYASSSLERTVMLLPPIEGIAKVTVSCSIEYMLHFLSNVSDEVVTPTTSTSFTYIGGTRYMSGEHTTNIPSTATRVDIQFKTANKHTLLNALSKLECVYNAETKILTDKDVVDNLYDGGSSIPLSAEQGKNLRLETRQLSYISGECVATFDDFSNTTIGRTSSSYIDISLDAEAKTIKWDTYATKTVQKYAWIELPSTLVNGEMYKIVADYDAKIDSGCDGFIGLTSSTNSTGYNTSKGFSVQNGKGKVSYSFRKTSNLVYLMLSSNSVGGDFRYVHLENIQFFHYYENLPTITDKVNKLEGTFFDNDVTNIGYYGGDKIPTLTKWKIGYKKLINTSGNNQAGCIYGDYFFEFTNEHASVRIYSLLNNTLHSTVNLTSYSKDHCNVACFSNIFYDANDTFPLVYTSASTDSTYNHAQVWRIQLNNNVFSIEKVQEITLPTGTDNNRWKFGQCYIDNEKGHLWNSTGYQGLMYFNRFNIPPIFDESNNVISSVTLTEEDCKDYFTTYALANPQGGVMKDGILYLLDGVPAWGTLNKLHVYNIWGKELINTIDIHHILNLTDEFEGCGIYNDTLIANTQGRGIYAIYF